jgi:dihydropteroate synthase
MEILGILNITDDSFSDGGLYLEKRNAIKKIEELAKGANIIDIGAQSSNMEAKIIPAELEWARIEPLIPILKNKKIKISIDTYKPFVIEKCIEKQVDFINNITSFSDEKSLEILTNNKNQLPELILMYSHNQKEKATANSNLTINSVMEKINAFFDSKLKHLQSFGIPTSKCILDPGMGLFLGEDPALSFQVIREIKNFRTRFGRTLVSVSRKSFLGKSLGNIPPQERNFATLAAELFLYTQGIDFIRTHEPLALHNAIHIWNLCENPSLISLS